MNFIPFCYKGGIFIYIIDTVSVTKIFARLSHADDEAVVENSEVIANAKSYIEEHIVKEDLSAGDKKRLELAAACVAVYDYTVVRLCSDPVLCTQNGKAVSDYKNTGAYTYAEKLRDYALGRLAGICSFDSFVFAGVMG